MKIVAVRVSERDTCVTLTSPAATGEDVSFGEEKAVKARGNIPAWHKIAIKSVKKGECVNKYGAVIGIALEDINEGDHVHVHNMCSPGSEILGEAGEKTVAPTIMADAKVEFLGYKRPDGRTGVRNHVVVMPGVVCADAAARKIANAADAVYLQNPYGCGQTRADTERTLRILSGLIANPNVYGALVVGLGCEFLDEERYRTAVESRSPGKPVRYICIQKDGGMTGTTRKGVAEAKELMEEAARCRRVKCDISELILGLECGGSDPTSGLSANVVLGEVSDRLVDMGGTTVMSETAEAIGAEHILRERAASPELGQALYDCVRSKDAAFTALGEDIRNCNPSPGNIRGGISTLEEKSLGCIHKSGTRAFTALVGDGEPVNTRGAVFMDTTAFDPASVTSKVAGGCQAVVFTTGLGNPIGSPIAPVIKMTGNSDTYAQLTDMLDFESGSTLTGEKTVARSADELMALILRVISGELVKAEINGAGIISIDHHNMLA